MKFSTLVFANAAAASPAVFQRRQASNNATLLNDITVISQHWGQITPYTENNESYFGVNDTGLPDSCQVEQFHLLERHGSRFPTGYYDDGNNDKNFAEKLYNFTTANSTAQFTGPLSFLNGYSYELGSSYLVGAGAVQSFSAGVSFWQRYGRIIFNATNGQLAYNSSYPNGTERPKPVLRTTGQSRIYNSGINWALGFFGTSYETTPNPTLANATSAFDWVVIPEGGTENNTLASYDSCFDDNKSGIGDIGDQDLEQYLKIYLTDATSRLQQYAPEGFTLNTNGKVHPIKCDTSAKQARYLCYAIHLRLRDELHRFIELLQPVHTGRVARL